MTCLWDISRSHVCVFQYPPIYQRLYELKDPFIIAMKKFLSTHCLYYFPYQGDNTPEEPEERKLSPSFSSRNNTLWLCRYGGKLCSWLCQESIALRLILHLSPALVSREMNEAKNGVITSKVCLQNHHFFQPGATFQSVTTSQSEPTVRHHVFKHKNYGSTWNKNYQNYVIKRNCQ